MRVATLGQALEAATRAEPIAESSACRIAQQSYQDARNDFKRFQNLVYIAACFVLLFLLAGIVLVALGSDTRGAGLVSFVGTVVSGVGMKFVLDRRNEASKEKKDAEALVREYCDQPQGVIERLEAGDTVGA